jgi:predicted acyltransferase
VRHTEAGWTLKPISHTRILGVLQRIALCYCIAALITHYLRTKWIILVSAILLLGYWALLYLFGEPGQQLTMLGNAGNKLDVLLMGENHLYHGEGVPFDPEGWLSTLPSVVNVIGGYLAGTFIQRKGKNYETIALLLLTAAVMIFVALFWGQFFPIGKKLWTSPFVLLTVGLDLAILSLLIYAVEIRHWERGTRFFVVFGKNTLAIYLLSELLLISFFLITVQSGADFYTWVNNAVFQAVLPGPFGSLAFAICYMLLFWLVGYWLHKRKIYIRI